MTRFTRTATPLFALIFAMSACTLPQGAGLVSQVVAGAELPDADFSVRYVTRDNLDALKHWPVTGPYATVGWIKAGAGPSGQIIEAGDTINLTLWDNEESSLLSSPGQKIISLPKLTVSPKGTVFLPYADEVYVAKMSSDQARLAIQDKLVPLIPSVQVQLTLESGRKNSVDLVSGVASPRNIPMPDRSLSVLSLIALGGGIQSGLVNPQIRLSRDGKLYGISMARLLSNPGMDSTLRGGDKVYIQAEERYFLSLGAAGREAQVKFPQDQVTALDAMSLIGGLNDTRANPKGILILRDFSPNAVRTDGTGPDRERMIFAFDLTTADGLFGAGDFPIQHRDLVMVAESPLSSTTTILGLIGSALGLAKTAEGL